MKKLLFLLLSLIIGLGTAHAQQFWTGSVFSDTAGFVPGVTTFDWASSGSGNAQGLGPAGSQLAPGTQFVFRYQSFLFALNGPSGQPVNFPGLNSAFEYTVVAQIPEEVVSVTQNLSFATATFKTLPGGQFFIYHDAPRNANVPSGFGFDDGDLVASGFIDPDQLTSFTFNSSTGQGIGSVILTGTVTSANPLFLNPAPEIVDFRFEGTVNYPPLDSTTAAFFTSVAGEGNLPDYTVTTNDLPFKVDGSHKFSVAEVVGNCRVTAGGVEMVEDSLLTTPCSLKPNGLPDPKTCAVQEATTPKKGSPKQISQTSFKDTWGGQAGASGIDGNWTHHHDVSPTQSFVFHSNTVTEITCSDCDNPPCIPAGANATCRQIDFKGTGRFTNQKGFTFPTGNLCYMVHLEDIGEPGPGGRWPSATDPCTHVPGTPINNAIDCMNCTDYYEIRVFGNDQCTGNPIYVNGDATQPSPLGGYFITSGNVQMHPGK